ncbi:MAG: MgtC/SapB family protein [Spirochaetia bacterium]|jgi:putative Mg2+ transporter-C (MgtC) family protein
MDTIASFLGQTSVDLPVTLFRLFLSFILGGLIGLEREWHRQSAGLRTHILICLGATLLTLLSIYIPQTHRNFQGGDPGRIAAQVITGIGFLGGGAIFRLGANVRGLTTAASIWIVAGIGMTVGAGMYDAALIGTGLVLFALFFMVRFEKKVFPARPLRKLEIVMRGEKVNTAGIFPLLEQHGIEIKSVGISQSYQAKTIRVKLTVQVPEGIEWNRFYREAGEMDGISKITLDEKL